MSLPRTLTFDQFDSIVTSSKAFENESRAKSFAIKSGGILYTQVDGDNGERIYMRNPDRFYNRTGRYEVILSAKGFRSPMRVTKAAKGYHGIISKPTRFLVGEKGPERVNVTPIKKQHNISNHNVLNIGKVNLGNIKIKRFI